MPRASAAATLTSWSSAKTQSAGATPNVSAAISYALRSGLAGADAPGLEDVVEELVDGDRGLDHGKEPRHGVGQQQRRDTCGSGTTDRLHHEWLGFVGRVAHPTDERRQIETHTVGIEARLHALGERFVETAASGLEVVPGVVAAVTVASEDGLDDDRACHAQLVCEVVDTADRRGRHDAAVVEDRGPCGHDGRRASMAADSAASSFDPEVVAPDAGYRDLEAPMRLVSMGSFVAGRRRTHGRRHSQGGQAVSLDVGSGIADAATTRSATPRAST